MKFCSVLVGFLFVGLACPLIAQVITPTELKDPKLQRLQQRNFRTLVDIGGEIERYKFPYPFYLSKVLDVDLAKMKDVDQRSIRFDSYKGETVLELTGNYYASYNSDTMDVETRLKTTFEQVIVPILKIEVPHFPDDSLFASFAIEVSHHVRAKVMGVHQEQAENVTVIIPVPSAQKLVDAKNDDQKQSAVLESRIYLNGQPYALWVHEGPPPEDWQDRYAPPVSKKQPIETATSALNRSGAPDATVSLNLLKTTPTPMLILTPEVLAGMQRQNQDAVDRMVKSLDKEAHFVPYAPPSFVGFRQGAYLQLAINTQLDAPSGTSRYKQAALAFDDHVSHLIRPLLDFFPGDVDFDGVDFSSVIHVKNSDDKTQSVEFFFPVRMMHCFASYDCTGQQLINAGTVLINGERSQLDLQLAEGKN
ncbi:MAG TPA: hypothetical protein VF772_09275 [Terriglobales bacterium]